MSPRKKPKVALVLGSGAARGWAHIGVIHELSVMGVRPDLVVGTSVGAVVGGAYASGNFQAFEEWVDGLRRFEIIRLLDAKMTGGGFLQGKSLMAAIEQRIGNPNIEDLDLFLIPPSGAPIELSTDNGGDQNNYFNTVFDDEGPIAIDDSSAEPPFAPVPQYRSQG